MKFVRDCCQHFLLVIIFQLLTGATISFAQPAFNRGDTLRGTLSELRSCFDVNHYDLSVTIDSSSQIISGTNIITFKATEDFQQLQLDLFENMTVSQIQFENHPLARVRPRLHPAQLGAQPQHPAFDGHAHHVGDRSIPTRFEQHGDHIQVVLAASPDDAC